MILYHGSNIDIREPVLTYSRKSLDFGAGFYLSTDFEQAEKWAKRVTKVRGTGTPVISVFETNEGVWPMLTILHFETANHDWLQTVVSYRIGQTIKQPYDVIAGPVADDRTVDVINQYIAGSFSEDIALQLLLPMQFKDQWAMKTAQAIKALVWKEAIHL